MAAIVRWYAIRARPGSQRVAKVIEGQPDERRGETILERECREKGVPLFMPSVWILAYHQRTNKLIEKRFPMFEGYAFVNISEEEFGIVRRLDSFACFLRSSRDSGPVYFRDAEILKIYMDDLEERDKHEHSKKNRQAEARAARRNSLNRQLGLIFPKGRRKRIPVRMMAEAAINSLPPKTKERVLLVLNELKSLDNEDDSCKSITLPLDSAA